MPPICLALPGALRAPRRRGGVKPPAGCSQGKAFPTSIPPNTITPAARSRALPANQMGDHRQVAPIRSANTSVQQVCARETAPQAAAHDLRVAGGGPGCHLLPGPIAGQRSIRAQSTGGTGRTCIVRPRGRQRVRHSPIHWGVTDPPNSNASAPFLQTMPHDRQMTLRSNRNEAASFFRHTAGNYQAAAFTIPPDQANRAIHLTRPFSQPTGEQYACSSHPRAAAAAHSPAPVHRTAAGRPTGQTSSASRPAGSGRLLPHERKLTAFRPPPRMSFRGVLRFKDPASAINTHRLEQRSRG